MPRLAVGVTEKDFLQAIWGPAAGVAELATITKVGKETQIKSFPFTYPASLDSLVGAAKRHTEKSTNVYMGVCLRREQWPRKNRAGETEFRGTEENTVSARVVWTEFDFAEDGHKGKTIPAAEAQAALKAFPLKPSIVVRSGGGIQVYWLLKEPAIEKELFRVKSVTKAVQKFLNSDPQSTDLARILRVPWTKNVKYTPPRTVEIAWWQPEFQYTLDDFDFLPLQPVDPNSTVSINQGDPGAPIPSAPLQPRATPTTKLGDDDCIVIGKRFAKIWFEGYRHEMALCVAGWLAHTSIMLECATEIVRVASNEVGGDTKKRIKDVEDTYRTFCSGANVKGYPHIEEVIGSLPSGAQEGPKKILAEIMKLLPKKKDEDKGPVKADFKILKLIKFTSQPARWTVTIEKGGKELVTSLEHSRFIKYDNFVEDVCDQNTTVPEAPLKNNQWRRMINQATENGLYEEHEAPAETRPAGAIEKGLQDFLSEAKENPDAAVLKKFPGYDEESTFFLIKTFKDFLDDSGNKFTQNHLVDKLKAMGWESATKRFGRKVPRVWIKAAVQGGASNGNGNGNGNGHPPPEAVTPKDPQESLFSDPPKL